jgi:hypothetical protein
MHFVKIKEYLVVFSIFGLLSLAGILLSTASANDGRTFYISADSSSAPSEDSSNPGNAKQTIDKICDGTLDEITQDDEIVFLGGTYPTSSFGFTNRGLMIPNKTCLTDYLHIRSVQPLAAVIEHDQGRPGPPIEFDYGAISPFQSRYIWIDGFHIIGRGDTDNQFEALTFGLKITAY